MQRIELILLELKNIYLVQAAEQFSGNTKAAYLPYAVGTVAAKAWSNKTVREAFNLDRIVFLREPIEQMVDSLNDPFLIGFSNYIWNYEYNKAVAKKIKVTFPECLILFGGHNVPSGTSLLEECDYIDILIHGEGEEVFEKLLCTLASQGSLSDIPNISYRQDGIPLQTTPVAISGFDYPSPYTNSIFKDILKEHPDMQFSAILESNRGCANNCAFCDWGPLKTKVRMFPLERVKEDVKWFSENKIDYIWGADANFGQFDRDIQIAEWMIEAKGHNGYPSRMKVNYAKYNSRNVFELARRFSDSDLSKSTTISFQTLSNEALKNIGRRNMTMDHFSDLIKLYRASGIPTYSEMILALPGETYDSFTRGIGMLLDSGQHSVIEVYDCVMLPNSILAEKDYIDKHKIKTVRVPFVLYHCEAVDEDIIEYADIVISTKSMSKEDWVKCKLFTVAVQSMHCLGLLRCFSIYLHHEKQIAYSDFYIKLVQWYLNRPGTLGYDIFTEIHELLQKMPQGINAQYFYDTSYGDVRWYLDEGAFFRIISDIDRFYNETKAFLNSFAIDEDVFEQLLDYQKSIVRVPDNTGFSITQDFDFYNYILHGLNNDYKPLEKIKNTLTCSPNTVFKDLTEYAREIVWYGRRLGRTLYTGNPESVAVKYL